jgi:protein-tyrosine phosphatase
LRFADLHNHLLPGVDDGCRTMEETVRYLERFASEGVAELVMTPHVARPAVHDVGGLDRRMSELREAFARVLETVAGRDDLPRMMLGQELFAPDEHHLAALLEHPEVGLGDTGFLLVERGAQRQAERLLSDNPLRILRGASPLPVGPIAADGALERAG